MENIMDNYTSAWKLREEIERRKGILINHSYDNSFPMESVERARIKSLLERGECPIRPLDVQTLLKQFCVSSFSYSPLRKYLFRTIGGIPMRDTISRALSCVFEEPEFLNDSNWRTDSLGALAMNIQAKNKNDLSRKQLKPRIIAVLLSGTSKLHKELSLGLDPFYDKISKVILPVEMWRLVNKFSVSINQVGPALICDFFKEIGFIRYVKVDHHFRKEFPKFISSLKSCNQDPKHSFILSQEIADSIGITPFHLDSILYLWGRYGNLINTNFGY